MATRGYDGLRLRIVVTVLAFSLLPLLAVGTFMYAEFTRAYKERITGELRAMVESQKRAIDMFLEEKLFVLRSIALTNSYIELAEQQVLSEVFNTVLGSGGKAFVDLGVIDETGRHVAYVGPYNLRGVSYAQEDWFHQTLLKGVYISDVFLGHRKYPHFIIAVARSEGHRHWILRATIDSEAFSTLVKGVQVGQYGDAFIINGAGMLQSASRFQGDVLDSIPGMDARQFSGVRMRQDAPDGRELLTGLAWLERKNWLLVIREDPREGIIPLLRVRNILLGILLAGLGLVGLGAAMVSRTIVQFVAQEDRQKSEIEASLLQSSKMAALGKMAAGVAHEINNPLALIRESAGWLKDLLAEESPAAMQHHGEVVEYLDKIDQHVERARTITHRMLGFAKRLDPIQESVDLNALAEQTLQFLQSETALRNIGIVRRFDATIPPIATDPAKVQQVILNLVENAIDAIGKDGSIVMSTGRGREPKEVWLRIADSGPGIPRELQRKVFDPFFTTKAPGEGTGLGLSICYTIVQSLGGRIDLESEPGQGAVFTVFLPEL